MPESQESSGYAHVSKEIKTPIENKLKSVNVEFRKTRGETFLQMGKQELLAPETTDFPAESGDQLQIVDRTYRTQDLGESPILSEKVKPKAILSLIRLGIIAEEKLVEETDNVWANLNLHSRPPITNEMPVEAQYDDLTIDIHGRNMKDASNWALPPAIHGVWGMQEKNINQEFDEIQDSFDKSGDLIPATPDETKEHMTDPDSQILDQTSARVQRSEEFTDWKSDPQGKYNWDNGRRKYTPEELEKLRNIFGSLDFLVETGKLDSIELFPDAHPTRELFEPNKWNRVVWSFGGYQLTALGTPFMNESDGIHLMLEVKPHPSTPWDSPQQTLEAFAIGLGVTRLLKDTKSLGEIGDVYLDMNSNWSMTKKREELDSRPMDEVKAEIQKNTKAHLHIQLEKAGSRWEVPPAPDTFGEYKQTSLKTLDEIEKTLKDPETGLTSWVLNNCSGRLS